MGFKFRQVGGKDEIILVYNLYKPVLMLKKTF